MAEKRRGGKPTDVLSVSLFLLEDSNVQRINKNMCSKSAIERLRELGYGPSPDSKASSFSILIIMRIMGGIACVAALGKKEEEEEDGRKGGRRGEGGRSGEGEEKEGEYSNYEIDQERTFRDNMG